MSKGSFEKIRNSDRRLYGPRKLLLTGFAAGVQTNFKTVLQKLGFSDVALVWATEDQLETIIDDLVQLPDGSGNGRTSSLPRAVIVGGITEKELQSLISGCRKAGMKQALWATLTPTSVTWRLQQLLSELAAEHAALSRKK
ncbi:MAG: DUF3783 domain-containing protein [Desulfobacteraceae bacterium]|jgi:hypothetical protein